MRYWLMKSEPGCFSVDDLAARPDSTTPWDGVRNYQARNFMRDDMKAGDRVLFYHSNCEEPGVAGLAEIACEAYADYTAFNPAEKHYDPKSVPEKPVWMMVDVKLVDKFDRVVTLKEIKADDRLSGMELVRKGSRLSVQPVSENEYKTILRMAGYDEKK
ncbi:EVE domain-containing protein [Seleniivibrio woodruffii]|uniref:EVE domain-containing protein n=1 Tax=Seleniivibrio woodruffii TaxID=1078050 RepID=UPI00240A2A54|nr:EVE domain-containing protein [Seleniivibrio woodruffii]